MKTLFIIFFAVSCSFVCSSQDIGHVDKTDSIKLVQTWHVLVKAIETKNRQVFRSVSLTLINCSYCIDADRMPVDDFFVPVDTLIKMTFGEILGSPLWKEIKANRFRMRLLTWKDFRPRSVPPDHNKDLELYGLGFSFKPGEFAEGSTYTFEFIKIKNGFKLFGLETVP